MRPVEFYSSGMKISLIYISNMNTYMSSAGRPGFATTTIVSTTLRGLKPMYIHIISI